MLKQSVYRNSEQTSFRSLHTEAASSGLRENVKLHKIKMSTYQRWHHFKQGVGEFGCVGTFWKLGEGGVRGDFV